MHKTWLRGMLAIVLAVTALVGVVSVATPALADGPIGIPFPGTDCTVVLCAACPNDTFPVGVPDECCPVCVPLQEF